MTNTNLYDALLMGTKRIGHGINLFMHAGLMNQVKEKDVCIECCPVSNQLLRYVDDIRLHPIKTFLNYGIKVVIAPDDPSYFNSFASNDDFYYAAIGSELGKHFYLYLVFIFPFDFIGTSKDLRF